MSSFNKAVPRKGYVRILSTMPPATSFATADSRAGGSILAESVDVFDFDDTSTEYMDYMCLLENYNGGGLTFKIAWSATSATTGDCRWSVAIRRMPDDAEDIDTSQTYDFNSVNDTCASVSGELSYTTITFTDGSDMDSWADGEIAIVRLARGATNAADTMVGDAELWSICGYET